MEVLELVKEGCKSCTTQGLLLLLWRGCDKKGDASAPLRTEEVETSSRFCVRGYVWGGTWKVVNVFINNHLLGEAGAAGLPGGGAGTGQHNAWLTYFQVHK